MSGPVEASARGVRIHLHVAPRASRTRVCGIHDQRIKLQVASPPVDGAANDEIVRFLVKTLGVRKDQIAWIAGETSKRKTLEISEVEVAYVAVRLGLEG